MAYTLQAIVAKSGTLQSRQLDGLAVVKLGLDFEMIPLGSKAKKQTGIPFCPFTDEGRTEVPEPLDLLCARLSQGGAVAYIEAEIFGGAGAQANVLYSGGRSIGPAAVSQAAINDALRWLGLEAPEDRDEFDSVGLGLHRDTDSWLK